MNANSNDDDLLLAVRYVTGECDASEAGAFEERLADDEAAQYALVEATRIVALLKSTPCCPQFAQPETKKHRWGVGTGQWGVVLAACVVVAVGVLWTIESGTSTPSPALAQAWSSMEHEPVAAIAAEEELVDESQELAAEVPDWLLTAVLVEQGEADDQAADLDEESHL